MTQKTPAERRKHLVRTMNELGDIILKVDELAKEHADGTPVAKGFRQIVVAIEAARGLLQTQYNELLSKAGG
jgi:hypothetical protein